MTNIERQILTALSEKDEPLGAAPGQPRRYGKANPVASATLSVGLDGGGSSTIEDHTMSLDSCDRQWRTASVRTLDPGTGS